MGGRYGRRLSACATARRAAAVAIAVALLAAGLWPRIGAPSHFGTDRVVAQQPQAQAADASSVVAGDLLWVRSTTGSTATTGTATSMAADGSVTAVGWFQGSVTFGAGENNETTLSSPGSGLSAAFVAHYAPDGTFRWARSPVSTNQTLAMGVDVGVDGTAMVTGYFVSEPATFGLGEANETTLTATNGSEDLFVARYADDGSLVWARSAGGDGFDVGLGVAVDAQGRTTVTGMFGPWVTFGLGEPAELTLTGSGSSQDVFVARYGDDGSFEWARSAQGDGYDQGRGVAPGADGSATVTGSFREQVTFGAGEANETTLTLHAPPHDGDGMFLVRYGADGTLLWARSAGGPYNVAGEGVATAADQTSVVTGSFAREANFGSGEPDETTLTGEPGSYDAFVARYGADGSLLWARSAGGPVEDDMGRGVAVATDGSATITGSFAGAATFGSGEANETTLLGGGFHDIYVAQYTAAGMLIWARAAGAVSSSTGLGAWHAKGHTRSGAAVAPASGSEDNTGFGVALADDGGVTITGRFQGTATFGAGGLNETTLSAAGSADMFLAHYAGALPTPSSDPSTPSGTERELPPVNFTG